VQAGHAACQLVYRFGSLADRDRWGEHGPRFVWYGLRDEAELREWASRLGDRAVAYHEPDLAGELTALAYWGERLPAFDGLPLL
jgi:hypothetical protein